ncbi:39S ribosomal protein L3, mitochondrial [Aphelenchoides bicaudatus]|nr:39S ribosomal protein L3, mitochondrial [Aphelenchoides bicaudatus]
MFRTKIELLDSWQLKMLLFQRAPVLDVRHFQVGQYVAVSGKTIDWGFQGGVHRWGMRGMPKLGTTKSHRRIGSVGSTGDASVWPGKKMPGHMGYEWRTAYGLEVLRINPLKQVIYVRGTTSGDIGELLLIKDCLTGKKAVKNPPFPTYVLAEGDVLPDRGDVSLADITRHDIYSEKMFQFNSPSIVFTEQDETQAPARDKSRAKTAKVKK